MKGGRKKPITLEEYLQMKPKAREMYAERYQNSLKESKGEFKDEEDLLRTTGMKIGKYSLKTRIKNNPWLKTGRPSQQAIKWLFQEVFKNPSLYQYRKNIMFSGGLFTFEYKNPKYKGTTQLPWFDKFPLVLSLGGVATNEGIRNVGFNLHLLPPKIRIIVICQVFDIYKTLYRYNIFFSKTKPVNINYKIIMKACNKYGASFAIRMYIPQRQRAVVLFPYTDWYRAIFIPSRSYEGIKAAKLIQEWQKYVRKLGFSTSARMNWNNKI